MRDSLYDNVSSSSFWSFGSTSKSRSSTESVASLLSEVLFLPKLLKTIALAEFVNSSRAIVFNNFGKKSTSERNKKILLPLVNAKFQY